MKASVRSPLSNGRAVDVGTGQRCLGYRNDYCEGRRIGLWCMRHWLVIQQMKGAEMAPLEREKLSPNGRVFRIWWECPGCRTEVGAHDAFCRHCGEQFG